jgi:haloalkane dehalogenase
MVEAHLSEAEQRFQLLPGQFPFRSRFLSVGGARLHYVDEGAGPLLFMLHGNPTWSFLYRHLINALRGEFRCVAVDLAGFGLSDPPDEFGFRPDEHAGLVARLMEALDLRDATLIAHDWGGPIGLSAMIQTRERITRLCLGNTWAWPVNGDFHFEWFSKLMGGPVGRFGSDRFALFINGVMPRSMRRRKLSPEEMRAYRAPFAGDRTRRPMSIFPWQITAARNWLGELLASVSTFHGPVQFIWPNNDIAFREKELTRWLRIFPHASVARLPRCGHFLWEDAPEECIEVLRGWMAVETARVP